MFPVTRTLSDHCCEILAVISQKKPNLMKMLRSTFWDLKPLRGPTLNIHIALGMTASVTFLH